MSEIPKTMDYWVAEQIIAAHKAGEHKGVGLERERIIKLLQDNLDDDVETDALHYQNVGIKIAIALIKGENK